MRILILGGDGMLGHRLFRHFRDRYETRVTLRQDLQAYAAHGLFHAPDCYAGTDVRSTARLMEVLADFTPHAVVNAVGIVKQRSSATEAIPSIEINSLLPHRLALACRMLGARFVHMSTDCVFAGTRGAYSESDTSDATDLYGRTKFLGEVADRNCVTLRSSIIGLELSRKTGLIEWFLAQRGTISGYELAVFSGITTTEMARVIEKLLVRHSDLCGLWQVASQSISKYALLTRLAERLGRTDVTIVPDRRFQCDRSLDGSRFCAQTGYQPPSWDAMLDELAGEIRARRERE